MKDYLKTLLETAAQGINDAFLAVEENDLNSITRNLSTSMEATRLAMRAVQRKRQELAEAYGE